MIPRKKYTQMYAESDHQCFQISIRSSSPGRIANLEVIHLKKKSEEK